MGICIFILILLVICYLIASAIYKRTDYFIQTKKSLLNVMFDVGCYGEYLTYKYLRGFESDGAKFLYNCYLPRDKGRTTEVDVMMIHKSGVYVFESKNYSGWIFGSEHSKTWTQSLPNGRRSRKEHFLNPIMQNKLHIKWLENQIGKEIPVYSIIVFSERCTLKSIEVTSLNVHVIKRGDLLRTVKKIVSTRGNILQQQKVDEMYSKLLPFTQVTEEVKQKHIADIKAEQAEADVTVKPVEAEAIFGQPSSESTVKNAENEERVCPKCGGKLVLRTSNRGDYAGKQFYGCANYPKCRYIKNV